MRTGFLAAIVVVLAVPSESAAHRLDEYLQAARVSLARDGVTLEVDLTPGANIASAVVPLLDRNGDDRISPAEAGMYGQMVLADLVLELDGRPVALTLTRVETSSIDEMRGGLGIIQLRAAGRVDWSVARRRQLYFRNNHQPATSVYLVNALLSEDREVGVARQTRDPLQREVHIDYRVAPRWSTRALWLALGVAVLATLIVLRREGWSATRTAGRPGIRQSTVHS